MSQTYKIQGTAVTVTSHWGGVDRGRSVQLTGEGGQFICLNVSDLRALIPVLTHFEQGTMVQAVHSGVAVAE